MATPPSFKKAETTGLFDERNLSLRRVLGRLREFLDDAAALEPRDVVDEEHAVEVVDLVLQAGGEEAVRLQLLRLAVDIEILHPHLRGPLDLLVEFGN